jgi:hypothetical protein
MVEGVRAGGAGQPAEVARDGTKTAETRFSLDGGPIALPQNGRLSSASAIGLESMLALQAIDERVEGDRLARKRGTALLAALTRLQRLTIGDQDASLALRDLDQLAAGDAQADDPGLAAILRAIVLRSRVEIARREYREDGPRGD